MPLHLAPNLSLPDSYVTSTGALLAMRGAGKSNTGAVIAEEMFRRKLPFVAIDPVSAWWGLRSSEDGRGDGLPIPIFGGKHGDLPLEATAGDLIADLVVDQRLSCILDLKLFDTEADKRRFLLAFAKRLLKRNENPLHLFLEECDDYLPQKPGKNQLEVLGAFEAVVRRGRASGLGITLISQRSAVVNKNVLTQTETLFAMRVTSPQDRDAVEAWLKYHASKTEILESLASLDAGEAWVYSPHFLGMAEPKRVQIRRRETFDSGATPANVKAGSSLPVATLTDIDLGKISERMRATIEKAEQTDPTLLQARVRELSARAVHLERELERVRGLKAKPAVKAEDVKRLELVADRLMKTVEMLLTKVKEVADQVTAAANRIRIDEPSLAQEAAPRMRMARAPLRSTRIYKIPDGEGLVRTDAPEREVHRGTRGVHTSASGLGKMHRAMLTTLAQAADAGREGLSKKQIRQRTGYRDSGPVSSAFADLQREGWAEANGQGYLFVTPEGRKVLGAYEQLPRGRELREALVEGRIGKLSNMERRFLELLFLAFPKSMSKKDLRETLEYADSGPVSSAFGHLVALDYATAPSKGELRAADELFEEA
jgi:hypothetical protein